MNKQYQNLIKGGKMKKRIKNKLYKNREWYNAKLYCTNKTNKASIEKLIEDIYEKLELKNPEANAGLKKMALNVLISNAYEMYLSNKIVAIPFGRGYYTTLSNTNPKYNTFRYIVDGAKALIKIGYFELVKCVYVPDHPELSVVSGIKAMPILIEEINRFTEPTSSIQNYFDTEECYTFTFSNDEFKLFESNDIVELKDSSKEKRLMEYRPNEISLTTKNFLRAYNNFISDFDIKIPLNKINPSKYPLLRYYPDNTTATNPQTTYTTSITTPLIGFCEINFVIYKELRCIIKRVFNNGVFTNGGRFYEAEYQFLSEEERSWITIDNEPVVEIDYKTFHPRILYHKEQIDIKGDLYQMVNPEKELRPAIKKMMNIMINANNDRQSVIVFKKELLDDEKGVEIQTAILKHRVDEWDLTKMIRKAHKPIGKYFRSKIGVKIQYEDSELARSILTHFMKKGIACLCVHDSFLVQEKYKDELFELMMNEYEKRFKFKPELEINKRKEVL